MLVLSRKKQERINIGDDIVVTVLRVKGNEVRIGIEAPHDIRVMRGEIADTPPKEPDLPPAPPEPKTLKDYLASTASGFAKVAPFNAAASRDNGLVAQGREPEGDDDSPPEDIGTVEENICFADADDESEYELGGICPVCKSPTTNGYGLAYGGGIGPYEACEQCDWFRKSLDPT